jgi:hypothetical protein
MAVFIVIGSLVLFFFYFKPKSERWTLVQKYGIITFYLKDIIPLIKSDFPQYVITKSNSEEYYISCRGNTHSIMYFFSWVPGGLYLRMQFNDFMGRKYARNYDMHPDRFGVKEFIALTNDFKTYALLNAR